ncbi:hypothetical protein ACFRCI_49790 [Streptomyces sp. NPDC056638]|uniref:hypothetical protein n=1 Tax=Streptomyces sp. NPDC056638 TaxID=3345887 RepID=UPI003675DE9D
MTPPQNPQPETAQGAHLVRDETAHLLGHDGAERRTPRLPPPGTRAPAHEPEPPQDHALEPERGDHQGLGTEQNRTRYPDPRQQAAAQTQFDSRHSPHGVPRNPHAHPVPLSATRAVRAAITRRTTSACAGA